MIQVSVIIINYNTREITNNCIESIKKFTKDINYEIILVDNASNDGSIELFSELKEIVFIQSPQNIGFGKANNLGVKYARGEYILLLNSDTILCSNAIKAMYDFFINNEKELNIGVLGCTLVGEDGNENGSGNYFPSLKSIIIEKFGGLPILNKFLKPKEFISQVNNENFYKIDYVLGADMFFKKDLFNQVGGFNPEYFMYYEEAEIQRKIYEKSYFNYILKNSKIIHLIAKSSDINNVKASNFKRITVNKSRVEYLKNINKLKYYKPYEYLFMVLIFLNFRYSYSENIEYCKEIRNKIKN
ncbi:TPA: glycosyltransferase family 2 protein [Elizabethkingia anophelis]